MVLICGIDEAGRGPVLGPLVMAGVLIEEKEEEKLRKIEVKDSKLLTKEQREALYKKIIKIAKDYKIVTTQPKEIDKAVNGHDGLNLNWLEAIKSADIINKLNPNKAIIDAPSSNIPAYKEYLSGFIKNKQTKLILEHKADLNYPVVSAASILAKVTRDKEIEKIKKKIKHDFGSGYPSDPKTIEFLEKNHEKHKELFRKSWMPYKNILNKKLQKRLGDFSEPIKGAENKDMAEKLKSLEDLGYTFIPVKTPYESVRMKGPCTITLYKSGKLLIQGKEENKKIIERILKNV
jgi:ribonuclease HII|tara:strand:+ start:196 stop:1068 length:873 start_codon:yes stop_codon:yes gene_type:complete